MKAVNKTKIYRCGLLAIVLFCLTLMGAFCLRDNHVVDAGSSTPQTIYIGDVLNAKTHTVAYDGGSIKATGLEAVCPSGGIYGGSVFTIEQAGDYAVTYYAVVNGKRVEDTRYYTALRKPQDLIYSTDGATVDYGKYAVENPYKTPADTYGTIVTFKAGTSVQFSTTIPTEKLTADYNILDLIVVPSVFKESDFERLTVRITDSEDPDNYVDVVIDDGTFEGGYGQVSYVRAGANGQQIGGYENAKYHTANWGTPIEHSFRGFGRSAESRENNPTLSEQSLTLSIDHAEKKVLCGPISFDSKEKLLVNDLDDVVNYKGNPWGGFTSDEVTVKVTANSFTKATGAVLFKSFGDYDLSQDIRDGDAPTIALDYPLDQALPTATVGKDFFIIPFTAKDALDAQVKTDVYVYYLDENGERLINVSNDGKKFVAKYAGVYEIVYCAEDYSGNKAKKSVKISANENEPKIFLAIDNGDVQANVYDTISVLRAEEVQVFGGHGCLQVERTVYSPSGKILDVDDAISLTELGDYKIVYKATDYLQQVQYGVVTVHSQAVDAPTFIEMPQLNKVLIKGFIYDLPQPFVVEVVDNAVVNVPCEVYVNGQLAGSSFTADGEAVTVKYVAKGKTGTTEKEITSTVVDTKNGGLQEKYFYTEGDMTPVSEKSYLQLSFKGTAAAEFIKELYSDGFSFAFDYEKENVNFTAMSVILTDAADSNLSVTLRFAYDKVEDVWMLQVNGKGSKIAYTTSKGIFNFSYSSGDWGVADSSGTIVSKLKEYDNGLPFNGFSNLVYFRMEFEGGLETSSINLTKICNQSMGYRTSNKDDAKDTTKPVIFLNSEFQLRQQLGAEAIIPTATACDVLGQISQFTVTVSAPNGSVLHSGSATEAVKFSLNEVGNYKVVYYAKDSNGKYQELSYLLRVYDETAPTITVNGTLKSEYKVGDKISIPGYSATDNNGNCTVQVEVVLPNNEIRLLQYNVNGQITWDLTSDKSLYKNGFAVDANTFVAEYKGVYVLRFLAYDDYYNCVVREIKFKVS